MKFVLILNLGLRLRQARSTQVKCFSAVALSPAKNCPKFDYLIPNRNITKNPNGNKFQDLMRRNFCSIMGRSQKTKNFKTDEISFNFYFLILAELFVTWITLPGMPAPCWPLAAASRAASRGSWWCILPEDGSEDESRCLSCEEDDEASLEFLSWSLTVLVNFWCFLRVFGK